MNDLMKLRIGDVWRDAQNKGQWEVLNPATEEPIQSVPFGDGGDAAEAISAARAAFDSWSHSTPYERARILNFAAEQIREQADEFAHITVMESGKPMLEARGEWMVGADMLDWFAEESKRSYGRLIPSRRPHRRLQVVHQPIGVVGVITAWNFPVYNPVRAWAAALAAGCTVVAKPSEYTPLTAMLLTRVLVEAGLPAGVLNLINGDAASIGDEMLSNPHCRKISFTGSTRVGKILQNGASKTMTRLSLELGGTAPVLILPDADLDSLKESLVIARFRNCGQVCIAPQRFLVHESCHQELIDAITPQVKQLVIGNGMDTGTQVGPLINATQRDRVEALVQRAQDFSGKVLAGGRRPADRTKGYFFEPTLVDGVGLDSPLVQEEIFGPVLAIETFSDLDEVMTRVNQSASGLAAYVWTHDQHRGVQIAEQLEYGMVAINDWAPHATEGPFTGWKESGLGSECGTEGLAEYLETKMISMVDA